MFLVSDALIALHAFADLTLLAYGLWVMLTYVAGQALLVAAVLRVATASRAP
ncbi:MAG: lysoplasmalogenase family protein [Dermatophilaceae bacterium]